MNTVGMYVINVNYLFFILSFNTLLHIHIYTNIYMLKLYMQQKENI